MHLDMSWCGSVVLLVSFMCDALVRQRDAVSEFIYAKYVAVWPRDAVPVGAHGSTLAHHRLHSRSASD